MNPKLRIDSWEKSLSQDGDCWSSDTQYIVVKQDDGGGGPYWIIETDRWAFDSIEELVEMLETSGVGRREQNAK
jgi:hypothetical protein